MKFFLPLHHHLHDFETNSSNLSDQEAVFEVPRRITSILTSLKTQPWADILPVTEYNLDPIKQIHPPQYLNYLENAFTQWQDLSPTPNIALIPYSPKIDRATYLSKKLPDQDGFFCTDLYVPVNAHTWQTALTSAYSAISAANILIRERTSAAALCRPPGHHAGAEICGGFCYLNNAAISAHHLSKHGKVAILDIDYHAGNGTQSIFYHRADVLTISLHADPSYQYPFFAGFAHETGEGSGKGYHHNFPLPPGTNDALYLQTLDQALDEIFTYKPQFLVLSAGLDTDIADPIADFALTTPGFSEIGALTASLDLPTLIILEGGYRVETLGENFTALVKPLAL